MLNTHHITKTVPELLTLAADLLTEAYAAGEESGSIEWSDIDQAHAVALAAKERMAAGESPFPQELSLAEYTEAIQKLEDEKVERINAEFRSGKRLFGAMSLKWTPSQAEFYYRRGYTPAGAIASVEAEAEADGRAEALGS